MSDQDRISPDNNIKKIGDENKEKYWFGDLVDPITNSPN